MKSVVAGKYLPRDIKDRRINTRGHPIARQAKFTLPIYS